MKPELSLLDVKNITLEDINRLFTALTGREPTGEDDAEVEALYAELERAREERKPPTS